MRTSNKIHSVRRLLLVDDDYTFAQVAARSLTRRGFEVVVANDTDSALNLANSDIDYAIVDLVLGNASGLQLLSPLKTRNHAMRILVLSGYASTETIANAIGLGATCYLAKPVGADEIVAALMDFSVDSYALAEPNASCSQP